MLTRSKCGGANLLLKTYINKCSRNKKKYKK